MDGIACLVLGSFFGQGCSWAEVGRNERAGWEKGCDPRGFAPLGAAFSYGIHFDFYLFASKVFPAY